MPGDEHVEVGEQPAASDINRELTPILVDVGRLMGFATVTEYAVPGGRRDVVWLWEPPSPIPGVVGAIPVAGFEIESSWRTRKHVRGDLLNLQDAGVALGVIVLAGADARDESLRRFAETLVDRPGPTVLVWTHDDVRALGTGQVSVTEVEIAARRRRPPCPPTYRPASERAHTGKYRPLWEWLLQQERRERRISFSDLERQAGITSRTGTATRAVPSCERPSVPAGTPLGFTSMPAWCLSYQGTQHGGSRPRADHLARRCDAGHSRTLHVQGCGAALNNRRCGPGLRDVRDRLCEEAGGCKVILGMLSGQRR